VGTGKTMATLRLTHRRDGATSVVDVSVTGIGQPRQVTVPFAFDLTGQDQESLRWYLEDYPQHPADPSPLIAERISVRLAELGCDLFSQVFGDGHGGRDLLRALAGSLTDTRVEIESIGVDGTDVPWELIRATATSQALALRVGAFVRTRPAAAGQATWSATTTGPLRVLLVICRPGGDADVPFRSVSRRLVEFGGALRLDVLRPPTFEGLTRTLRAAKEMGTPYHLLHFDGHGTYLGEYGAPAGAGALTSLLAEIQAERTGAPAGLLPGAHGYLLFEDPASRGNQELVDGATLGRLLTETGVPVLVLNACRSAHTDPISGPATVAAERDAHQRVIGYGSLAQEALNAGVAGVVAMRYNVYVPTAAHFIAELYQGLLAGQSLGTSVSLARRKLADEPLRRLGSGAPPVPDWLVPVVYEAAPIVLAEGPARPADGAGVLIDPAVPDEPYTGFIGQEDTLLALDRAFDTASVVLLTGWAGAGKTATAAEFARWYARTGPVEAVLFSSFSGYRPLPRLFDQLADLLQLPVQAAESEAARRERALSVLARVPVLWIWDDVAPVAGFPAGTESAWSPAEQAELASFVHELARNTRCKVLLTSRRDEQRWLGYVARGVPVRRLRTADAVELARAVAAHRDPLPAAREWPPLVEVAMGNPLVITAIVWQAILGGWLTGPQLAEFGSRLRTGTLPLATSTGTGAGLDDRAISLTASLDYGFAGAFTEPERARLALLTLFADSVHVAVLCLMGEPEVAAPAVPQVTGLRRDAATALLDRAAEAGMLIAAGDGWYVLHPAVPCYLRPLFEHCYGPMDSGAAATAVHAWTAAMSGMSGAYSVQHGAGHAGMISMLRAAEANLLRARQLAREHGWWDLAVTCMDGLNVLYNGTGRDADWRRLVAELAPDLADPVTGAPLRGYEQQWETMNGHRARIAAKAHDWPAAERLQQASVDFDRERAAAALAKLATVAPALDDRQRNSIRSLGTSLANLGEIVRMQDQPSCAGHYLEAASLFRLIHARREEASVAGSLAAAYEKIAGLRDLDSAQRWAELALDLHEPDDADGRARVLVQLGSAAHQRYLDGGRDAAQAEQRTRHVIAAARFFQEALSLFRPDAVDERAVVHQELGSIFGAAMEHGLAIEHYQQALALREQQGNRLSAALIRYNMALALQRARRREDALAYARAALRALDAASDAAGDGAAGDAERARQLIAQLEAGDSET
jgi:tetratricopeptide (TPR) repeat protein